MMMWILSQHMLVKQVFRCLVMALGATSAYPQLIYNEGFDAENASKVRAHLDEFTDLSFVNYSEFDVGVESHSIVEAPRRINGSAATQGILLQANVETDDNFGEKGGVILTALDEVGGSPVNFTGNYRVAFDVYVGPVPVGGMTGHALWKL
jgi:hypothetical protein